jgi:hypothetical protein
VDDAYDEHAEAHLPGMLAADFSFGAAISFGGHRAENTRQSPAPATTENTITTTGRDLRL